METQYILIRKNKSEAKSIKIQSEVKTVIKEAGFDLGNIAIVFSKDNYEKNVMYKMSYDDNNVLYLNINSSLRGEEAAKLLSEFDERFTKGKHRAKFYIINAYSDASYWFCSRLMPKLGSFERLLREFIYLTLTRAYGSEWIKIFDSERKEHIAEISQGRVSKNNEYIEVSLEWLEFAQIEDVLFSPCSYEDTDTVISEILSDENITKDEMLIKLKSIEKKSLWEREFQEFSDVKDLQYRFNDIRNIRNTVMHNKTIGFQYYEESIAKIETINKQLMKAIEKIKNDIYAKPKEREVIKIDSRPFVEAVLKALKYEEELARKAEIGKRLIEKFDERFAQVRVSDLLAAEVAKNDMISKKLGNG